MNFQFIMKISCEISNENGMTPALGNPLIKKFREQLKALKLKDDLPEGSELEGSIQDISNFEWQQVHPMMLVFNWDLKINCIDVAPKSLRVERFNNSSKNRIGKLISGQIIQENGSTCAVTGIDYR